MYIYFLVSVELDLWSLDDKSRKMLLEREQKDADLVTYKTLKRFFKKSQSLPKAIVGL